MSFYLRFDLFDKNTLPETQCQIFKDLKISCTHFGRNILWIGDFEGIIYKFDKDFSSAIFIAYENRLSQIYQCKDHDILITCGMDSASTDVIKFWDLSKWNKQNIPTVLRSISTLNPGDLDFKVICFNVLNNLNTMVIGLENGKVDLVYSDVLNYRRSKRKQIYDLSEIITTVAVNQINDLLYIYITSNKRIVILAFNEQTNDIKVTLDVEEGACPRNCSGLIDNVFVVANQKGIYDVYLDYVGPCRALDGDNLSMHLYKHYLILVKLIKPSVMAGTHLVKKSLNYQIVIFDHVNRFIACEYPLPDFNFLFIEWGSIYVYCSSPTNKVYVFTEKDVQSKLKIFFQKNSFKLAIEIAKSQHFDEDSLADMFCQHGDHLYREKHFDEAIIQYIKTIGKIEPSFVINKYLTTSQIPNLVKYMEVLVQRDDCIGEHNALLLNCYIILKDQPNLLNFIKTHKIKKLDIDKVFNLLRKVRFLTEALELAERYKRHDWYLKILIEDLNSQHKAIEYISKLPLHETEEALLNYGNMLINVEPEILAKQLERVCDKQNDSKLNITTILNVFVNNRKGLKHFLKRYISKIISIEENYSVYVDTLLELLLYEVQNENSEKSASEVMDILQNEKLLYHRSKALVCCQMREFSVGYRYLCELDKNYLEILYSYQSENNIEGVMDTCHKFGSLQPALWLKALEYLIDVKADSKYFTEIISEIEARELISPLLLLEKLTISAPSLKFGLVKDFVLRYYERNEKLINDYQNEISKLKEETKKNNDTIQCLDTQIQVFQNLRCTVCSNMLDIPSVHFLCNHSYHLRCFETYTFSREECPTCAPNVDVILSEINQWQSNKINSLVDISTLSLEKLWCNVLSNSHHPVTLDPDQFLSNSLSELSIRSFGNSNEKKDNDVPDSKLIKVSEKTNFQNPQLKENLDATRPIAISSEIKNSKLVKVGSVEKFSSQSPGKILLLSRNESPIINVPDKTIEAKRSIPISKNPFDTPSVKASPTTSGSIKSDTSNYPDNLNPFEQ